MVISGPDGLARCAWGASPEVYVDYHDTEWGFPQAGDARLFEKLVLEGFQAGLSWLTILRKRPAFREAFAGFEPSKVATFDEDDIARLLADASIVRHEGKIRSAINNAERAEEMIESEGALRLYFWPHGVASERSPTQIPAKTETSIALARDLKRRGWTFVGPTTVYAFMQAIGLVNDHVAGCWVREDCEARRRAEMGL